MAIKQTAGRDRSCYHTCGILCRMAEGVGGIQPGKESMDRIGQILVCVASRGYYREWGKEPVMMTPGENGSNEWLEAVTEEQYAECK